MAVEKFPIEAGHIMVFARAIADDNPIYYDQDYACATEPGRIIAPPSFVQASAQFDPDYFLRPKIGQPWIGSGKAPTGIRREKSEASGDSKGSGIGGLLHAEQHFEYHRPIGPGDVLTIAERPGRTWEKQGKRAGKLLFSETVTEYRNQDGELAVTARGVAVMTQRPAKQGAES